MTLSMRIDYSDTLPARPHLAKKASRGNEMEDRIVIDPGIMHGKPSIRGTRVTVARLVGALAGGQPPEEVTRDFGVTEEDLRAALAFAAALVESEEFHTLPLRHDVVDALPR